MGAAGGNASKTNPEGNAMTIKVARRSTILNLGALAIAPRAFAQGTPIYPSKPIQLIVPYPAGGAADLTGRLIAEKLRMRLGQTIVVENRAGANGIVGTNSVARSAPDGHTLLVAPREVFSVNPVLSPQQAHDWKKDLEYIGIAATGPYLLIVNPSLGVRTLAELAAVAKAKDLSYASFGKGSMAHLNVEALGKALGVKWTHVPYRGSAPAVTAVATGEVALSISTLPGALPLLQDNRILAIAAGSPQRLKQLPDVPTMAEQGVAEGALTPVYFGLATTGGTPAAIIQRLSREMAEAVREPDIAAKFEAGGLAPTGGTPADFAASVAEDVMRFGALIRELGISVEQ
jgi:tripartite-type tricarboxylate transporter receptor subunit TctC